MLVLVTGARAPVAIEWANALIRLGHRVILTDSLKNPLGAHCYSIEHYIKTHSPRFNFTHYRRDILAIIDQFNVDMVIPTCEEIYYLAQCAVLRPLVNWLLPSPDLLFGLHHKYQVFELINDLPEVLLPVTRLIRNKSDVVINKETILKPVYSRFGSHVIRQVTRQRVDALSISPERQWVQQQKIQGESLCNYALFEHGELRVHQAYLPKYCVNQSAASGFKPVTNHSIHRFMVAFGRKFHFHGQVSFDFMIENECIYVIECNPRATSGLHLVAKQCEAVFPHLVFSPPQTTQLHHLGVAMLFSQGATSLRRGKTWQDYLRGQNVMRHLARTLRFGAQFCSLFELFQIAKRYKISLSDATTYDIEWNGHKNNE